MFTLLFAFEELLFFYVDDFLAVVVSAASAYTVVQVVFTTLGALGQVGLFQSRISGASLVSSCTGNFFLRYCHCSILLLDRGFRPVHVF